MNRLSLTLLVSLCFCLAARQSSAWSLFGSSESKAAGRMKSADRLMEKADIAFEEGRIATASNGYARAIGKYRAIDGDYPGFNGDLALIRIEYCEERIAECATLDGFTPGDGTLVATPSATNQVEASPEQPAEPAPVPSLGTDSAAEAFYAASGETPPPPATAPEADTPPAPAYNPRYFAYDFGEASDLVSKGHCADAIDILVPMVKYDPDNRQLRMLLASARLGAGQSDMAVATLEDLRGSRQDLPLLLMLAAAYTSAGRYPEALLALDSAVKLAPGEPDAFSNLAWLTLLMDGDSPESRNVADGYYQQALRRGAATDVALEGAIRGK